MAEERAYNNNIIMTFKIITINHKNVYFNNEFTNKEKNKYTHIDQFINQE